ncbi:MAG: TRL-like family protein [Verrucomicrobiia bacterium]
MKKILGSLFVCVVAVVLFTGCAMVTPMNGSLYTDMKGPVAMGDASHMPKTGTATATAIIGIATGDASIETAMKNGGITKVHHVDTQVKNILGVYAEYTTVVYGE